MEEYVWAYAEAAYENPGHWAPMEFMDLGGGFHKTRNISHWLDQKHPSFPITTRSENMEKDNTYDRP